MAKPDLGTKRIDPETGKKFYDLNRDPVVSPYTGTAYPRSFFESGPVKPRAVAKEVEEDETEEAELDGAAEFVTLEEADGEAATGAVETGAAEDDEDEDVAIGDDDGDVFIEEEEEEGDDVTDIIGDVDDEER